MDRIETGIGAMYTTSATKFAKVVALSSLIVVAGATQSRADERDVLGLLIGGGLGALAGSQFGKGSGRIGATAGGAVLGALIGSAFAGSGVFGPTPGYAAERHDRRYRHYRRHHPAYYAAPAYRTYYEPAYQPAYQPVYEPAYASVPAPSYPVASSDGYPNEYCREFETVITINGVPQPSHGNACYRPDGSWRIVP